MPLFQNNRDLKTVDFERYIFDPEGLVAIKTLNYGPIRGPTPEFYLLVATTESHL